MALLRFLGLVTVVVVAAACDRLEPSYHACAVACAADGACPDQYRCSDDGFCHAEDEYPVASCAPAGADAAPPDAEVDAAPPDAAPPDAMPPDAMRIDAGPTTCDFGTATNSAAVADPALFAQVIPFAGGASLPAGTYSLEYVDGCSKYAASLWWSIHGHASGDVAWWLVGASSADRIVMLPGTVGLLPGTAGPTGDQNGFEDFAACVAANRQLAPLRYQHPGGPLGIFEADIYYPDNVSGQDGRNPRWRLVFDGPCPTTDD
ncbi:MAG: hypothetical protein H6709_13360 [Kofleriaceae bacterium]|nr:hypothetical protein [Kofleriaceae bacterium]MCB9573066.1 hypothetical protein [Kofleriaceae bacterium]